MREVTIRAAGVVSPCATTGAELLSFISESRRRDRSVVPLAELEAAAALPAREVRKLDRFSLLAVAAARRTLNASELSDDERTRCGVVAGNMLAGWTFTEPQLRAIHGPGLDAVSPYLATAWFPAAPQGQITIHLGMEGFAKTVTTDRCSGAQAIGLAWHWIRAGRADLLLAGGVEAPLTPLVERALAVTSDGEGSLVESAAFLLLEAGPGPVRLEAHETFPVLLGDDPGSALVERLEGFLGSFEGVTEPVAVVVNAPIGTLAAELITAIESNFPYLAGRCLEATASLGESLAASGALAAAIALEALAGHPAPASAWAISWGDQCCDLLCLHKVLD